MDYTDPTAGSYRWAQFDGRTGYYNSHTWQDGTNTPPEITPIPSQKWYTRQQLQDFSYSYERGAMYPTYPCDDAFEHGQTVRYVSPGATQASNLSEASYSGESLYSIETPSHTIRYSPSPVNLSTQHPLKLNDSFDIHHMPWQPQSQQPVLEWHEPTVAPSVLPSQHSLSMEDRELEHEEEKEMVFVFDNEIVATHTRTPNRMPQPEVVVVSEPNADSMVDPSRSYQAKKSLKEYRSEDDMDEEDELIPEDAESDSDYQMQPRKRKSTRNSSAKSPKSPSHRRKSSNQSTQGNYRVHKRSDSTNKPTTTTPPHAHRASKSKLPKKGPIFTRVSSPTTNKPLSKADRTFPCTFHHFGCPAEFPNKNEWKRHVACQHLQLGYYRCDLDGCNPGNTPLSTSTPSKRPKSETREYPTDAGVEAEADPDQEIVVIYNDFNRKDLFTQHCRRMHGPTRNPALCTTTNKKGTCIASKEDEAKFERQLDSIRSRCWNIRRRAPARSSCGFCDQVFDAAYYTATSAGEAGAEEKAWEERMEHVGRHYEKGGHGREVEGVDEDLVGWGLETGVLRMLEDGRAWLVGAEVADAGEQGQTAEDKEKARKARRQPSRTVVVKKRGDVKAERELDSDVDAYGEDE